MGQKGLRKWDGRGSRRKGKGTGYGRMGWIKGRGWRSG